IEVKNAGFLFLKYHFPTAIRKVLGRIAWYFNSGKMPETRRQSMMRAETFLAKILASNHENILLVTHGFFMRCLMFALRKKNFSGKIPLVPRNATLYVFEK